MALTTTSSSGSQQGSTTSPQTVPSAQNIGGASAQSGGVQPGTSRSVLTSSNGISLSGSSLTAVSLDKTVSADAQARQTPATQPASHHVNGVFVALSIILIVVAIGLFWWINRSAKSTTNY